MRNALLCVSMGLLAACVVGDEEEDYDDVGAIAGPNARLTIVQHNIEKKNGPLDAALGAADGATGITLQEVCPGMLDALRAKAQQKKWTISAVVGKNVPLNGCGGQIPYVVAIWTGGANGSISTYEQLGSTPGTPGQMACVAFPFKGVRTNLCSVKLISADSANEGNAEIVRRTQTATLRTIAKSWFAGGKDEFGIIAGDFNANPDQKSIDALYAPQIQGNGDFTEYNRNPGTRQGRPTSHAVGEDIGAYSKKIDYVFFSTNRAPINGPAVTITPTGSDHDMVVSTVSMAKN